MDEQIESSEFRRALVEAYPVLLRYAEGLAGNRADAWDLVQETMERGLRHRARFQYGDSPNGWLATMLRRLFIDRCRHARAGAELSRRWQAEGLVAADEPAEAASWEAFAIEDVRRALMFVGPVFRVAYALFAFDRLSYAEIGRRLSLPAGTIATRVFRARQQLRQLLTSGEFRLRPIPRPAPAAETGRPLPPLATPAALAAARPGNLARYRTAASRSPDRRSRLTRLPDAPRPAVATIAGSGAA